MNPEKRETLKKLVSKLYVDLGSGDAVMKKLGMSRTTVYRLLHEAGVELPDRHDPALYDKRKTLRGEIKETAIQDYINGVSMPLMRKKYGVANAAVYTAIKDAGIARRPHGGQARKFQGDEGKEMARLYTEEKLSQSQIGAEFGCSQPVVSRVLREQGVIITRNVRGENHGNWVGGRSVTEGGYIQVLVSEDDPMVALRNRQGYALEHRLVMARAFGRPLFDNESVHHIDGNRENNLISNLQLRVGKHGKGQAYQCADCGSYHVVAVELKENGVSYEV